MRFNEKHVQYDILHTVLVYITIYIAELKCFTIEHNPLVNLKKNIKKSRMSYTRSTSPVRRRRCYIYSQDLGGGGSSPLAQCPRTSQNGFNFNFNFIFFSNFLLVIRYPLSTTGPLILEIFI